MGARFDVADKLSPAKVLSSLTNPNPVAVPTPIGHQEL